MADIFCSGQWTDIKFPLKRTTWYWTISENLNRAVQKREKAKKKQKKKQKKKEKLVAELMLMWLSRFQLSSPRCRPSPSSTPQVFSVHPSLSSTSSPSSYALVGPSFIFFCFMWLLVYEPSRPLMWIYCIVLKLETTLRFFSFFFVFLDRTVRNFNFT